MSSGEGITSAEALLASIGGFSTDKEKDPIYKGQELEEVTVTAKRESSYIDLLQNGLDVIGVIPGVGEFADGINSIIYFSRGDYLNATLSMTAMIPLVGTGATITKYISKVQKHHLIPNQIFRRYKTELKNMGYKIMQKI